MSEKITRDSVLVIDDNADFRGLIAMIGQLYNVPVLEAPDCREGLNVLGRKHASIKLVFLDYFMPGMEPAACARAILAEAGPLVHVVLMTAAADPGVRATELQISHWISKPVDPSVLIGLMTQGSPVRRHE